MPTRLQDCVITSDDVVDNEGELVHYVEPVNTVEALKNSKSVKAMNEEMKSIEDNNTWSLVEFPQGKKDINFKWVYKVNMNPKGEVTRHKGRIMAKGFLQKERIDFNEVFAPVARIKIIRLVIGLAEINSWRIYQVFSYITFVTEVYLRHVQKIITWSIFIISSWFRRQNFTN